MGYCFVRTEKIKNNAGFTRKYEHNYRTEFVSNAIPELRDQNEELVKLLNKHGQPCTYLDAFHQKIKSLDYYNTHKVRVNNVRGLEVYTSFSREEKENIDIEKWQKDNVKWIRDYFNKRPDKYGDNVISVMYHGDENGNVHCHAIVIPIDETGKLSAEKYIGGRAMMRKMQDSYSMAMAPHGLERGLKGSSARHEDIAKFYARLNERMDIPLPEKDESAIDYRERILTCIQTERAVSLRKLLEMDRDLRRKRDMKTQDGITAVKKAALKEKAAIDAKLAAVEQNLREQYQKVDNLNNELIEKKLILEEYNRKIYEKEDEIASENARAKEIHEKMGSLVKAKNDLDIFRYRQKAMAYAQAEMPVLAENTERNMAAIIQAYKDREIDYEFPK